MDRPWLQRLPTRCRQVLMLSPRQKRALPGRLICTCLALYTPPPPMKLTELQTYATNGSRPVLEATSMERRLIRQRERPCEYIAHLCPSALRSRSVVVSTASKPQPSTSVAIGCHRLPSVAIGCHRLPSVAIRGCHQGLPSGVAIRGCHRLPSVAIGCHRLPSVACVAGAPPQIPDLRSAWALGGWRT